MHEFRARVRIEDGDVVGFDAFSEDLPNRAAGQRSIAEWAMEHVNFYYDPVVLFVEAIRRLTSDPSFAFAATGDYEAVCHGTMSALPDNPITHEPGDSVMTITKITYREDEMEPEDANLVLLLPVS